jgi:hypothetical protein
VTTDESTKQFLEAEAQANQLVDELVALKGEVESYRTATVRLDGTTAAIGGLTDRLQEIAEGVGVAVRRMQDIGLPALLEAQSRASLSADATRADVASLRRLVAGGFAVLVLGLAATAVLIVVG